ncbi:MAG: hypothetical protein VYA27_07795, partial [Verrucomicrobiota bacterium]|nr:hypothetical protein [Verrucomicrobiota bacterium]
MAPARRTGPSPTTPPSRADLSKATMKLYVGNLPFSATEDEIRSLFDDFGGAVDLHIPLDRETGRP